MNFLLKQFCFIAAFLVLTWSQALYAAPSSKNVLKEICSGSCSGNFARIIPWSKPNGSIQFYEFFGDRQNCSHPPVIIYDSQGKVKLNLPEHPINPNNKKEFAQDQKLDKKHKMLLRDLKETKPVFCVNVK